MSDEARLKGYLSKYKLGDMTRRQVLQATHAYKGLKFKFEPFMFNDGTCMDLVNLEGTIPVLYKGSSYNIPICIWLMDTFPTNSPLCFVKPTADMCIKVSRCVDTNGKIYLPYLHSWQINNSTLVGLIKVMCSTFGETPPLYANPRGAVPQSTPYPMQPYMPQSGVRMPGYPPAPYPVQGGPLPYPAAGSPYPYPSAQPPNMPYIPRSTDNDQSGGTITEEHIKASLLSAVEDKLKRRLREQFSQNQAELETLRRTQQELTDGKTKLDEILMRLEKEQVELDKNISILQEKEQELEKSIAKMSEQDGVDPDEAVLTTAPLYSQLLSAFAEEATTEDAIYYMGEALRTGTIDLDAFLKQVRALSRKQFALRALMQKCRQKAGLVC